MTLLMVQKSGKITTLSCLDLLKNWDKLPNLNGNHSDLIVTAAPTLT